MEREIFDNMMQSAKDEMARKNYGLAARSLAHDIAWIELCCTFSELTEAAALLHECCQKEMKEYGDEPEY